jgi:hypothetical protein
MIPPGCVGSRSTIEVIHGSERRQLVCSRSHRTLRARVPSIPITDVAAACPSTSAAVLDQPRKHSAVGAAGLVSDALHQDPTATVELDGDLQDPEAGQGEQQRRTVGHGSWLSSADGGIPATPDESFILDDDETIATVHYGHADILREQLISEWRAGFRVPQVVNQRHMLRRLPGWWAGLPRGTIRSQHQWQAPAV